MKQPKFFVAWTIFDMSRRKNGTYEISTEITVDWVAKTLKKLEEREKTYWLVFADLFIEKLYGAKLDPAEKMEYLTKVRAIFGNLAERIVFETDLVDEIWSRGEFFKYAQQREDEAQWGEERFKQELINRQERYNPKGFLIPEDELQVLARGALGLFAAETYLIEEIMQMETELPYQPSCES